jgi:cytochrome b6-f complex iron-sulfur subunit
MDKPLLTKSGSLTESRRKFLERTGASIVLATFGAAFFTSCSSTEDADPATSSPPGSSNPPANTPNGIIISGNTISINLSLQTALNISGNWLLIENARTLVANVNGAFVALTSVCTHSGCDRNWTFTSNRFTCTCHGSVFDSGGSVLQGPATAPLRQYGTQVSGTTLVITR